MAEATDTVFLEAMGMNIPPDQPAPIYPGTFEASKVADSVTKLTATLFKLCLQVLSHARDGQLNLSVVESLHLTTEALLHRLSLIDVEVQA